MYITTIHFITGKKNIFELQIQWLTFITKLLLSRYVRLTLDFWDIFLILIIDLVTHTQVDWQAEAFSELRDYLLHSTAWKRNWEKPSLRPVREILCVRAKFWTSKSKAKLLSWMKSIYKKLIQNSNVL